MTYISGSSILASDYNSFAGSPTGSPSNSNKVLHPFINGAEATEKVAGLIGIGYGDRGYGQTSFTIPNLSPGNTISSSEWTNLRNAIEKLGSHQGTSLTNLVPASDMQVSDTITAHDGAPSTNNLLGSFLPTLDTNRLNTDSGLSMSVISSVSSDTRTTSWSSTITASFQALWSTSDAARYFFNSGGELRLTLAHPTTTGSQNTDWNNVLSTKVGTFTIKAHSSTRSGSAGTVLTNSGFYELTSLNQNYYDGTNIGGGAYASNDVFIACRTSGTTSNGAPGNRVIFDISLVDSHTGPSDVVASGTNANFDILKATVDLSGIESPTWSVLDTFNI